MIRTSKKVGLLALIMGLALAGMGGIMGYIAIHEKMTYESQYEDFKLMSCSEMQKDFEVDAASWKYNEMFSRHCIIK